jgi:hypothetical protein
MEAKKTKDIIGAMGENPCGDSPFPILFVYVFLEALEEV